jgi:SAM-dependent methyltransferase
MFAEPMTLSGLSGCSFYHSMDLPSYGTQHGVWDLRGRFDEYTAGVSFASKTVLDVGTASGFLTFEAEKRGATVVSVDAPSAEALNRQPFEIHRDPDKRREWLKAANAKLDSVKRSYWLARQDFGSQSRVYYGDAVNLPDSLGQFDIVMVGQILVHLRDVIAALTSISARCRSTLIIAEGMVEHTLPLSFLLARANTPQLDYVFWHHSVPLYTELLDIMGFELVKKTAARFPCRDLVEPGGPVITTLVFERRS